jgi:hypothetical protein
MRPLCLIVVLLVGCCSSDENLDLMDSHQSAAVGFVVPLRDDGLMLLWVRQGDPSRPGAIVASVVRFFDNRWIGGPAVKLGRGLSAQALRSNYALNLQIESHGEFDSTHDIMLALGSDARRGFILHPTTLVKLAPTDSLTGDFTIMAYALTKIGDQIMVIVVNSDALSFRNGRFVPDF